MDTAAKLGKAVLLAAAAIAVVAMVGVGQSRAQAPQQPVDDPISDAFESACPSNISGPCNVTGLTAPNGIVLCTGTGITGRNIHATPGQDGVTNPITSSEISNNLALYIVGNGNAGTAQTFAEAIAPDGWLCNAGQKIDPATWVNGPVDQPTTAQTQAPFYNKVTASMFAGLAITGSRWADPYGSDYCSTALYAQTTNDFNWADEMHGPIDNSGLWTAWTNIGSGPIPYTTPEATVDVSTSGTGAGTPYTACGYSGPFTYSATTPPVPTTTASGGNILAERGHFGSSLDERESQHFADGGGDVAIRPVTNTRDAQEAAFWIFWPPFGHRSQGGANEYNWATTTLGAAVYRSSYNDNLDLFVLIRAPLQHTADINGVAAVPGVDGIVVDTMDLARQMGSTSEATTYANKIKAAAAASGKYYCTLNWTPTPVATNPSFSAAKINCPAPSYTFYRVGQPFRLY